MSAQDRVLQAVLPDLESAIQEFWDGDYARRCGSEIERIFAATAFIGQQVHGRSRILPARSVRSSDGKTALFLEPQYVIGNYRADFLLGFAGKKAESDLLKCVVVECDGHDYHERTKAQAARDKARDRYLSSKVARVVRFTGSELYRDAAGCLMEAMKLLGIANGLK